MHNDSLLPPNEVIVAAVKSAGGVFAYDYVVRRQYWTERDGEFVTRCVGIIKHSEGGNGYWLTDKDGNELGAGYYHTFEAALLFFIGDDDNRKARLE